MEEEQKELTNEEEKKPDTPDNSGEGDKPESTQLIDDANLAAKRLEEANKKQEDLLNRQEELAAKTALGGKAEAGGEAEKEPELSPQEYSKKVMAGEVNPLQDDGYTK